MHRNNVQIALPKSIDGAGHKKACACLLMSVLSHGDVDVDINIIIIIISSKNSMLMVRKVPCLSVRPEDDM